jgi:hypothetical protein
MNTKTPRLYPGKDVEMLNRTSVILAAAIELQADLQAVNTRFTEEYFDELTERVDNAMENIIGLDKAATLRTSTAQFKALQKTALEKLSMLQAQIKLLPETTKDSKEEILTTLGFKQYYRKAANGDQDDLIQLLYRIHSYLPNTVSLVPGGPTTMRSGLEDKGIPSVLINDLNMITEEVRNANTVQEGKKDDKKELTAEALEVMNGIYTEIITLCKLAQKAFKDNPTRKDRFVFKKMPIRHEEEGEEGGSGTPATEDPAPGNKNPDETPES